MTPLLRMFAAFGVWIAMSAGQRAVAGDDGKADDAAAVEYEPAPSAQGQSFKSIAFRPDHGARMTLPTGESIDLKWSTFDGVPYFLRLVDGAGRVWWYDFNEGAFTSIADRARLQRSDGRFGLPTMFRPRTKIIDHAQSETADRRGEASLVFVADDLLDLITPSGGVECRCSRKDDVIEATLPDGTKRHFKCDERGYEEVERHVRFVSLAARRLDKCVENLRQLATLFNGLRSEDPTRAVRRSGAGWFCDVAKDAIQMGNEVVLYCPGDPDAHAPMGPEGRLIWRRTINADDPPDGCCSYATRDFEKFPLPAKSAGRMAVMCCRCGKDGRTPHHRDGVVVAFDDGKAEFLKKPALGLGPDDPIVVGPDSKSPILKTMIYRRAKK